MPPSLQISDILPGNLQILFWGSVGFWVVSVVVVIFSRKLRRKFWWGLCTLVSFAWSFELADRTTLVAIPVGAALVIAVAIFGPKPKPGLSLRGE